MIVPGDLPRRSWYRAGPVVALLFGALGAISSYQLSLGSLSAPGAGLWPLIVSIMVLGSAAALLAVDSPDDYEPWTSKSVRVAVALAALALFIVLFQHAGFVLPAGILLALWLRYLAHESWRLSVIVAAVAAVSLYVVFGALLGVRFPPGLLSTLTGLNIGI